MKKYIFEKVNKIFSHHASGYWYEFIKPRAIVNNDNIKLVRWLNFYYKRSK